MKLTTRTKKQFSGFFMSAEVSIEDRSVKIFHNALPMGYHVEDPIRLRDTAEALLAAADFLDSLK